MNERVISGVVQQTVHVDEGERVTVSRGARVQATVSISGELVIDTGAAVQGTVHVRSGGRLVVDGALQGTMSIDRDAEMHVGERGKASGTLTNRGVVTVAGAIGGALTGEPPVMVDGGRRLRTEVRDGITYVGD